MKPTLPIEDFEFEGFPPGYEIPVVSPPIVDTSLKTSLTWSGTGMMINLLEHTLKLKMIVEGQENLVEAPTLYVVNHFTRIETFILPYLLNKYRGETPRSMAHHSLFFGKFGRYITHLGAVSTKEPLRNRLIIGDLMTGRKNWVIYPEGVMVKNKKFLDRGNFMLDAPEYKGPPRTGAAVLALKAAIYKNAYLKACAEKDLVTKAHYENRYQISGPEEITPKDIVITPVNITYYPIRPRDNQASKIAATLFKELPTRLDEELKIEGRILLGKTDMSLYFAPPITVKDHSVPHNPIIRWAQKFVRPDTRIRYTLNSQRIRLTNRFMGQIYSSAQANFDHLFCYGITQIAADRVRKRDFHNLLLLTALELQAEKLCRVHPSLRSDVARIALELPYEPLASIVEEAKLEGILAEEGSEYVFDQQKMNTATDFHNIRLRLACKVIANEFEPLTRAVERFKRNLALSPAALRHAVAQSLRRLDHKDFDDDYAEHYDAQLSKPRDVGEPFFLPAPNKKVGVLVVHGYLAAPREMRAIGEAIHAAGYTVYGARLKGHGTAPKNLASVSWTDWLRSVTTGYAILHNECEKVFIVGFSMGGLMTLIKAAEISSKVAGIAVINSALRVRDNRAPLAGAALFWNGLLNKLRIDHGKLEYVENKPANPEINYTRNYVSGVRQLSLASERCEKILPAVDCPTLIIQSSADPVVSPESARIIHDKIASPRKELHFIDSAAHGIVTNETMPQVADLVTRFFATLG